MTRFYGLNPSEVLDLPVWILESLVEEMPRIKAREQLSLANLIGIFSRQPQSKEDSRNLRRNWSKTLDSLKRIIDSGKKKKTPDTSLLPVADSLDKEQLMKWAETTGVKVQHGNSRNSDT